MNVVVQTPGIVIREFLPAEQEIYLKHFTDERVTIYLPKRSREERIAIFNKALNQYAVTKTTGIWGIFGKADNKFIGSCLLRPFNDQAGILELGYSLEHHYWGQGIATEMAGAIITYAFTTVATQTIVAVTTLNNTASQRVLKKAGLKRADNLLRDGEELAFFRTNNKR